LPSSSNVRRISRKRQQSVSAGIGVLPIPDPRTWPANIREWYLDATGGCGPLDVFIFNYGTMAAMYLQDAVTALGVLSVDVSEWHTERGFPAFLFDAAKVDEFSRQLRLCGYAVRILQPAEGNKRAGRPKRARVIEIAAGRERSTVRLLSTKGEHS
jgi:hypothetical protein